MMERRWEYLLPFAFIRVASSTRVEEVNREWTPMNANRMDKAQSFSAGRLSAGPAPQHANVWVFRTSCIDSSAVWVAAAGRGGRERSAAARLVAHRFASIGVHSRLPPPCPNRRNENGCEFTRMDFRKPACSTTAQQKRPQHLRVFHQARAEQANLDYSSAYTNPKRKRGRGKNLSSLTLRVSVS